MGTHDDMAYVTHMANRLGAGLEEAHRRAVVGVASHVAKGIRGEIRGATGGDMRLSGARNARIGIKTGYSLGGATPSVSLTPTGPLMLIEENTPPHSIRPRSKKALKIGDRFAARAQHPGTRGKHPWKRGVAKSESTAGRIYDEAVQRAIREAL